jgi:UDP-2,3-diacylglucosamine pyrophosphatase LpxH
MLIFFSDIHLTDGTSGGTINEGAFDLFVEQLVDLANKRRAQELRLVLLGDGLDVIRSGRWLEAQDGCRPWNPAGPVQERLVCEILQGVLDQNRAALEHLRQLPERVAAGSAIPADRVQMEYVVGNHDWLINRYESARRLVQQGLNLPESYIEQGLPLQFTSPPEEYDVLARHADIFDPLNYNEREGRDASSVGDVIIIELQRRFPEEVGKLLNGSPHTRAIVERLREIENVRPNSRIGAWVTDAISDLGAEDPTFAEAARQALDRCVGDFARNEAYQEFCRQQLSWFQRTYLRVALNQVRVRQFHVLDRLTRICERLLKVWRLLRGEPTSEYTGHALEDRRADGSLPRYVVYGHTHRVAINPLGLIGDTDEHRYYLNVGTWKSVWERAETRNHHTDFASWKEMSYAAIYHPDEAHGKHEFEMWTGALRDRSAL